METDSGVCPGVSMACSRTREQDAGDPQPVLRGECEVLIDVSLRIDDRGRPRLLISDEIRRVREATEIKLLQDHGLKSAHYE
jgi:hypothetical protein